MLPDTGAVVVAGSSLVVLRRNPDGSLRPATQQCFSPRPQNICGRLVAPGIGTPSSVVISPDGSSVYVTNARNSTLSIFAVSGGTLIYEGCLQDTIPAFHIHVASCVQSPGLIGASSVAVSPDGQNVYVASNGHIEKNAGNPGAVASIVATFRRAPDGGLTFTQCLSGTNLGGMCGSSIPIPALRDVFGPRSLVITRDGRNIYVAAIGSGAVLALSRSKDGTIGFLGCIQRTGGKDCGSSTSPGLEQPKALAIDRADHLLYATGPNGALSVLRRDQTGGLSFVECTGVPRCKNSALRPYTGLTASALRPAALAISPVTGQIFVASPSDFGMFVSLWPENAFS